MRSLVSLSSGSSRLTKFGDLNLHPSLNKLTLWRTVSQCASHKNSIDNTWRRRVFMILYRRTALVDCLMDARVAFGVIYYIYTVVIPQTRRTFSNRPGPQRRGEDQSAFAGPHKNNKCETRSPRWRGTMNEIMDLKNIYYIGPKCHLSRTQIIWACLLRGRSWGRQLSPQ